MAKRKVIDMAKVSEYYRIDADGRIWSFVRGRYLKPVRNSCGYRMAFLSRAIDGWVMVHRLVAARYIGPCPEGMEVNHKDGNRENNHYLNLEYVTHAENAKKSYDENGRVAFWRGKKKGPLAEDTRRKMAEAKNKAIVADTGEVWESIQACADALGLCRRAIYAALKEKRRLRCGLLLNFVG